MTSGRPEIENELDEEKAWKKINADMRNRDRELDHSGSLLQVTVDEWEAVEAYVELLQRQAARVPELEREVARHEALVSYHKDLVETAKHWLSRAGSEAQEAHASALVGLEKLT